VIGLRGSLSCLLPAALSYRGRSRRFGRRNRVMVANYDYEYNAFDSLFLLPAVETVVRDGHITVTAGILGLWFDAGP